MEFMSGSGSSPRAYNVTDDLTCADRSIQDFSMPEVGPADSWVIKIYLIVVYLFSFIAGGCCNVFLLYLIIQYKKLHTLTFKISLQIVALDLIQLVGVDIARLATLFYNRWPFGSNICAFIGFVSVMGSMARSLLMCVFVIDRFLSVFAPYFYPRHDKQIAITLSVIAWVVALVLQVPILPFSLDCYSYSAPQSNCVYNAVCSGLCVLYFNLYTFVVYIPATITPVVLYALLYCKVKKMKRADAAATSTGEVQPEMVERQKQQDRKSAITFFLLFMTAFALTAPANIVIAICSFVLHSVGSDAFPQAFFIVAVFNSLSSLLVVADPIVIMRHSDMREVLQEVKSKICRRCGLDQNQVHGQISATSSLPANLRQRSVRQSGVIQVREQLQQQQQQQQQEQEDQL